MESSIIIGIIDALLRAKPDIKNIKSVNAYNRMTTKEVISELSMIVYVNFKDNEELYDYFLTMIRNISPSNTPSIEKMKSELEKKFKKDSESLDNNHKMVKETFKFLAKLFNDNHIDYCFSGSIPCFLEKGIPLYRYHDDIDVMINEDDLEKVNSLLESNGFSFIDLRFPSLEEYRSIKDNKPNHQVYASNMKNSFMIGFIPFRREDDNSITINDYIQRESNNEVIVDRIEKRYSLPATNIRFNNIFDYEGINTKSCSIEHIYDTKASSKKDKDLSDLKVLELLIDKNKLKEVRRNTNTKAIVKNITNKNIMTM